MYTIGQVSEMFDLPISTLRYYDKEGLFPDIKRISGIRKFDEKGNRGHKSHRMSQEIRHGDQRHKSSLWNGVLKGKKPTLNAEICL